MTQLEMARKGAISEEMRLCAEAEGVDPEFIRKGVADGTIVVVRNNRHTHIRPAAIGKGLRTKINANIGTSKDRLDLDVELGKGAHLRRSRRRCRDGSIDGRRYPGHPEGHHGGLHPRDRDGAHLSGRGRRRRLGEGPSRI